MTGRYNEDDFVTEEDEYGIVHLGRGRRPYKVSRGDHGEFREFHEPIGDTLNSSTEQSYWE